MTQSAKEIKAHRRTRVRRSAPPPNQVKRSRLPRVEFARVHLLKWIPRLRVVDMLCAEFGIQRSQAYKDVRDCWAEIHESRKADREADTASLVHLIEEQIHEIKTDPEVGAAERARVLDMLVDRKARLVGAYPEKRRETVQALAILAKFSSDAKKAEEARAALMTDEELAKALAAEEKRLGLGVGDDDLLAMVKARFGADAEDALRRMAPVAVAMQVTTVIESGGDGDGDDDEDDANDRDEEDYDDAIDVDSEEIP